MTVFTLTLLTPDDIPTLKNLGHFYEYDMSKACGWRTPDHGLFESDMPYYESYAKDSDRFGYLIHSNDELAGFALINKIGTNPSVNFHVGEYFIVGKFQRSGLGERVAHHIWTKHPGTWEITVIPLNIPGLLFWERAVSTFTPHFTKETAQVPWDRDHPDRISFLFKT